MHGFSRSAASASALAALLALLAACSDTSEPATSFTATLSGAAEVPAVVTTATGSATLALSGGNINYTINVTGLSGPATLAHIHIAAAGVSGPVRVDLCGVAGSPACGAATTGVLVTGTATAANLHGATMEEVIQAMRDFTAYVNVRTAANSAGEIRGQILSEP